MLIGTGDSSGNVVNPLEVDDPLRFRPSIRLVNGRGSIGLSSGGGFPEAFALPTGDICYFITERYRCEENTVLARPYVCIVYERRGNRLVRESNNGIHRIYGPR